MFPILKLLMGKRLPDFAAANERQRVAQERLAATAAFDASQTGKLRAGDWTTLLADDRPGRPLNVFVVVDK